MADLKPALVKLLRATYPHPSFPDGPYERTADVVLANLDEDLWHKLSLRTGLESLDADALADPHSEGAETYLRSIADAEFFAFVRGVAVPTFYDDHEVWELLGYEGASFDQGGYVNRGFDDLAWLPDPRIEEYDGPDTLQAVADHDQPATA